MIRGGNGMPTKTNDVRPKVLAIAYELLHNKNHCYYTMGPNRWNWHHSTIPTFPFYSDCSGTVTAINYWAHNKNDPNGTGYAYGDTETILSHGETNRLILPKVKALHCDLVLFGRGPKPDHVAMLLQNGTNRDPLCFSMGRQGDPSTVRLSVLMGLGIPTFVRNVTRQ